MNQYSFFVILAYALWLLLSGIQFTRLPFHKAILVNLIFGWLFLPIFKYKISGFPDLDKYTFISFTLFIFCTLYEFRGKTSREKFAFKFFDFVVVLYCLTYIATSNLNELGFYEGFSETINRFITIASPYFIGRLYFSNISNHLDIAKIYSYLSFLYIPLAIFELRFSPQLHKMIYGYFQHDFIQSIRSGVWRPMVFMEHGLEVSLWLSLSTLIGFWLIRSKVIKHGFYYIGVGILFVITIISQSWGAIILLSVGIITLISCHFFKMGFPFIILFLIPSVYLTNKISNSKYEKVAVEVARKIMPLKRFRSLNFRLDQEELLVKKANKKMMFGWGRFGRYRIYDYKGKDISVTDSRWAIEYGQGGLFSLIPFLLIFIYPVYGLYKVAPPSLWHTKNFAPSAALAVGIGAILNDIVLNDYCSMIHFLIVGALAYPTTKQYRYFITQNIVTDNKANQSLFEPEVQQH